MSDELKPCPFCGNEPTLREYEGGWVIECEHHGWHENSEEVPRDETIAGDVDMCSWGGTESAKAALIAAWNARAERTCEMLRMPAGEKAAYSDTDEVIWHCRFCHAERAVYAFGEDGDVWAAAPKFCPECGAKAAKPPERTCRMTHVLLYDEEGVEGIECDECGWEDIHDWDDPLPERCPGCEAKAVG